MHSSACCDFFPFFEMIMSITTRWLLLLRLRLSVKFFGLAAVWSRADRFFQAAATLLLLLCGVVARLLSLPAACHIALCNLLLDNLHSSAYSTLFETTFT